MWFKVEVTNQLEIMVTIVYPADLNMPKGTVYESKLLNIALDM